MKEITYHKEGDYLIPDLNVKNLIRIIIYGRLILSYLKEHKRGLYTELMISGTLPVHLIDIDE